MRLRLMISLMLMIAATAACNSGPPPTLYVMEVTRQVTVVVTPGGETGDTEAGNTETANTGSEETEPTEGPVAASAARTGTPTATPSPTATVVLTPSMTPTPDVFPTPVVGQIDVAEQAFENGRMFWLEPANQIWVISTDEDGDQVWSIYEDTFEEGQPETDPDIVAPQGFRQPERGFGKLWRDNPEVRAVLGWAEDAEFGHRTRYEYHAGGSVTDNNEYVFGPGYHLLEALNRDIIQFNEADRTWEVVGEADE